MCRSIFFLKNYNSLRCRLCYFIKNCSGRQFLTRLETFQMKYSTMALSKTKLFEGKLDRFNGVIVNSLMENEIDDFSTSLQESLEVWNNTNKRGIWFKVALEHADWVPVLVKNGFNFHHAKNGFVMLYKWLPQNENENIPPYAHTMIGVGAIVVNDKSEILLVREKYGFTSNWKLPGGYVEPGENLVDAAIREVYEETHIETVYRSILNLRHAHRGAFGCSDMYVVVSLQPLTTDIQKCEREISESAWMDINECLESPNVHELNKFFVQSYLEYQKNGVKIDCKHGIHELLNKPYTVYYIEKEKSFYKL